jgi:hypothetical protein
MVALSGASSIRFTTDNVIYDETGEAILDESNDPLRDETDAAELSLLASMSASAALTFTTSGDLTVTGEAPAAEEDQGGGKPHYRVKPIDLKELARHEAERDRLEREHRKGSQAAVFESLEQDRQAAIDAADNELVLMLLLAA